MKYLPGFQLFMDIKYGDLVIHNKEIFECKVWSVSLRAQRHTKFMTGTNRLICIYVSREIIAMTHIAK